MSCAFDLNVWVYVHEMPTVKLHIKVLLTLLWIVWSKSILTVYFRPKLRSSIKMGEVWPMSTHVVMTTDTTHGFDYHQWWITDFIFITISSVALIEQSTGFSPFESSHSSTLAKNRHKQTQTAQTDDTSANLYGKQIKTHRSKKPAVKRLCECLWIQLSEGWSFSQEKRNPISSLVAHLPRGWMCATVAFLSAPDRKLTKVFSICRTAALWTAL